MYRLDTIASNITTQTLDHPDLGEIVVAEIDNRDSRLQAFYQKNFRPGHVLNDEKLFDWQFANNDKKVAVLLHNDVVIAHHGHIPVVFTDGETDYKGCISANVMVDEDYRRKGLMRYLLNLIQDRYDMTANLGASPMGVKLYEAMDYKHCGYLTRIVGIVDIEKCHGVSKQTDMIKNTVAINTSKHDGVKKIERFVDMSEAVQSLTTQTFEPQTLRIKRDADYLDWRYTNHPYFSYERYGLWDGETLKAVIICRIEHIKEANTNVVRIVELFGDTDAAGELVRSTVLHQDNAQDVAWIDWSCPYEPVLTALQSLGFQTLDGLSPAEIPLLCSPVDYYKTQYAYMFWAKDKKLYDMPHWYMTKGDGDADRPNMLA